MHYNGDSIHWAALGITSLRSIISAPAALLFFLAVLVLSICFFVMSKDRVYCRHRHELLDLLMHELRQSRLQVVRNPLYLLRYAITTKVLLTLVAAAIAGTVVLTLYYVTFMPSSNIALLLCLASITCATLSFLLLYRVLSLFPYNELLRLLTLLLLAMSLLLCTAVNPKVKTVHRNVSMLIVLCSTISMIVLNYVCIMLHRHRMRKVRLQLNTSNELSAAPSMLRNPVIDSVVEELSARVIGTSTLRSIQIQPLRNTTLIASPLLDSPAPPEHTITMSTEPVLSTKSVNSRMTYTTKLSTFEDSKV